MTPPKLECLVRAKEFLARLQRRPSSQSPPIFRLPPYRIIDLWYTYPMEVAPLLIIKVRYRGQRFIIIVDPDKFEGSPARELEFRRFYHLFASGNVCSCEQGADNNLDCDSLFTHGLEIGGCVAWAVAPCLEEFAKRAAPLQSTAPVTLKQRYGLEIWECNLYAKDERLLPDLICLTNDGYTLEPEKDFPIVTNPQLSGIFPSFPLHRIATIVDDDADALRDHEPRRVRIGSTMYSYKCFERAHAAAMTEVRKHERIAAAAASTEDAPPLRFWSLFGIAQSCRGLAAGLLFYSVLAGMPLREALACCDEDDEDELAAWHGAIAATVEALHARGAVWRNAVEDNIVVDEDGEVWLTEHEELWVDQATDAAMEKDWNIARLIQEHIEGFRSF
ncbi:hypothetical protein LEL_09031 [Akanthomyces lecanii RCEF 1005]|uniref:Protein kinase-like domain protein n=1 Tax=Akanthomyces lecanii RCEF 1005 TaxID=1081108 RepID=A0A168CU62_CORDF|nr:hypothetical protein LEL_09031 [Akanthomyces lecanii RCEF 1005]